MSDETTDFGGPAGGAEAAKPGRFDGPAGLAMLVLVVVVAAAALERLTRPSGGTPTLPLPMPELIVEGWLNTAATAAPSAESLRGRHVVIDCWATWCGPCVRSMPALARFHRKWRDRGVEVVGLTSEPASMRADLEAFVQRTPGLEWPVGYGAGVVQQQLDVEALPTYVLFGPNGRSLWRGHSVSDLEAEVARRL